MKKFKTQNGITLIALVITIIILLILAGVALSIVFNGGIIDKSQNAVDRYGYTSKNEADKLSDLERKLAEYFDGKSNEEDVPEVDYDPQQLFTYEILATAKVPEEKIDGVKSVTKLADISGTIRLASNSESDSESDSDSTSSSGSFTGGTVKITGYNYDYIFGDISGYTMSGSYLGSEDVLAQRVKEKFSVIVIPKVITINGVNCKVEQINELVHDIQIDKYGKALVENVSEIYISSSVTSIGNNAFRYCSGLTSITIGNSVTSIGNSAFRYCRGLTSITIPNSVTSIGTYAFATCISLTNVTISNNVTRINEGLFSGCKSLASITIPNGVTGIYSSAFFNCTSLKNITIPKSVTYIGNDVFDKNLETINYTGNQSEFEDIKVRTGYIDGSYVDSSYPISYYRTDSSYASASGADVILNATINYNYVPGN